MNGPKSCYEVMVFYCDFTDEKKTSEFIEFVRSL